MSKTITVSGEAYDRLARHKRRGDSFTDVILGLIDLPVRDGKDYAERLKADDKRKRDANGKAA